MFDDFFFCGLLGDSVHTSVAVYIYNAIMTVK